MKLLLYTHDWIPLPGGVQTVTMTLAQGLATRTDEQVEVTLVTQTPRDGMDDGLVPFRVVRQPSALKLLGLVRAADLLHIANPALPPLFFAWLLRKPVIVEHDGYQAACPNGLLVYGTDRSVCPGHFMARRYTKCLGCNAADLGRLGAFRALLFTFPRRWLTRKASRNIAPSCHVAKRVSLPRTQVIYHGVRDGGTSHDRSSTLADHTAASFAYVGRLVAEKGVSVLLRASQQLRKEGYTFRIKIIGDGPQRADLEELVKSLDLTNWVEFLGSVPVNAVPKLLSDVTAVVIPSVWEDVAPLVAIEQLMLGNLVIVSDIGGLGELVGGAGFKFRAADSESLASRMREALVSPALLSEMRARAKERASEQFTEERMVEEHLTVYRSVVQ